MRIRWATVACAVLVDVCVSAAPPPAPEGFRWAKNAAYSDEFDGTKLDGAKWYDHHPRWKGRPPAKFMPSSVSVADGHLILRNAMLPKPVQDGKYAYTIAGGAVVSRKTEAFYGYYEARMKASSVSMSSTFWFANPSKESPDGSRASQELDVVETVGQRKQGSDRRTILRSNSHYWFTTKDGKRLKSPNKSTPQCRGTCPLDPPADEAFHVCGVWWVDANHARIYLDDEFKFTLTFETTYDTTPFDRPMHLNMVTETYDWETPPTPEELADDSRNATRYDWVRAWTLVPVK